MTCSELTREHDMRKVRKFLSLWPFMSSVSVHIEVALTFLGPTECFVGPFFVQVQRPLPGTPTVYAVMAYKN